MSEPTFFRQEALEFQADRPGHGHLLRIPRWTGWLYAGLLLLLSAGIGVAFVARTDITASGPAVIDPPRRTFVALVPASAPSTVRPDRVVRLQPDDPLADGSASDELTGRVLQAQPAEDAAVRLAGLDSVPGPAVLLTGELVAPAPAPPSLRSPRLSARAIVVVGSEPVIRAFVDGIRQMLEGGGER